ncbi:GH15 family glucan-1,4-alpha-glucosidase [Kitasatospora sp. MAP12-15]|uniref:glycoside hydrolase family 15 protein n=1 Tax=unclassified Kitasatospora TaxID=2633591 RepID=UPI002476F1DE|nr:glycoside hydrolase family 15 protein [Kitasatospora sp. MAP12-44]MDH6111406.1 GH15 family glucan-1,4-alpha-glucosidase [Kitasatospora sp. MAP12-44]
MSASPTALTPALRPASAVAGPLLEDLAVLGDMGTAALIDRTGTVGWMCGPDFDSDAHFARLLGCEANGHWTLAATAADRRAADRTEWSGEGLVLRQEWDTKSGTVRVTTFMPPRGAASAGHSRLHRIVEGVTGTVAVTSRFAPAFGYGRDSGRARLLDRPGGRQALMVTSGPVTLVLDGPRVHRRDHGLGWVAQFEVSAGHQVAVTLTVQDTHRPAPPAPNPAVDLTATETMWAAWVSACTYQGPYREAVARSATVLKALTHAATGGIVAAPTTSLPEDLGGVRNWDYRYTWLRDAAITLRPLIDLGHLQEVRAWRRWLLHAVGGDLAQLQIMYGIDGRRDLPERELPWLDGYAQSRPVRVGNGAAGQFQLDVYGWVVDVLVHAEEAGLEPDPEADALLVALVGEVGRRWQEPDEGIWEVRGPRRHFVHSKMTAWWAVNRAITWAVQAERAGRVVAAPGVVEEWRLLREAIHAEVCAKGYDPQRNTFTQYYGSTELDASLLLITEMGFLPPDDKRLIGTIEAIQHDLLDEHGFVERYRTSVDGTVDGLPGGEGAFLGCSFHLVRALFLIGRREEAHELFERLLNLRSPLGLLAEEWDARAGRQVGNFPQAFSHAPLIDAALLWNEAGAPVTTVPGQRTEQSPAVTSR